MEKRRECSGGRRGVRGVPLAAIGFVAVSLAVIAATATPTFTIDSVQQRFPWSNTVDIGYTVGGLEENEKGDIAFSAKIGDGEPFDATNATVEANGTFTQQWDPPAGIQTTNCTVTGIMTPQPPLTSGDYMIVDLATGKISYENMTSQAAANAKYNTDEYKTTKMVFRKVPAGKYYYDTSSRTQSDDYYIGIFEVTVGQYTKMNTPGASVSATSDNMKPKTGVSWQTLCGKGKTDIQNSNVGFGTASSSCFIRIYLQNRVQEAGNAGFVFDLPSIAMYDIAARAMPAGDSSHASWNWFFASSQASAKSLIDTYAWCSANSSHSSCVTVGGRSPND